MLRPTSQQFPAAASQTFPLPLSSSAQVQPAIYVTYNGDFFDWPFIGGAGGIGSQLFRRQAGPLAASPPASCRCRRHVLCLVTLSFSSLCPAETRAAKHGMDMEKEIGFACNRKSNETLSRWAVGLRWQAGSCGVSRGDNEWPAGDCMALR